MDDGTPGGVDRSPSWRSRRWNAPQSARPPSFVHVLCFPVCNAKALSSAWAHIYVKSAWLLIHDDHISEYKFRRTPVKCYTLRNRYKRESRIRITQFEFTLPTRSTFFSSSLSSATFVFFSTWIFNTGQYFSTTVQVSISSKKKQNKKSVGILNTKSEPKLIEFDRGKSCLCNSW